VARKKRHPRAKSVETRLAVQYAVTEVLATSPSLAEASPKLLQAICEELGWDIAELWHVDAASNVLRLDGAWHAPALDATQFAALGQAAAYPGGSGKVAKRRGLPTSQPNAPVAPRRQTSLDCTVASPRRSAAAITSRAS
jgi:hypothetical protein